MSQTHSLLDPSYVLTLDEIGNLAQEGGKPAETLMNVVALIARRFQTDVCSAYLLEPDRANLVLAATLGLRRECIGTLRLALHEGSSRTGGGASASGCGGAGEEPSALQVLSRGRRGFLPIVPRRPAHRSRRGFFKRKRSGCWRRRPPRSRPW